MSDDREDREVTRVPMHSPPKEEPHGGHEKLYDLAMALILCLTVTTCLLGSIYLFTR